jgi:hypothetical protein
MGRISKGFSLLLVVILAVSSLLMVESATAQSIPKPSVPEFSVQFVDNSYDVPTTQTIDPYTGQEITNQGYHVEKKSIEVKIKNQPFETFKNEYDQTINLYYNIRIKGYFEENWTELYRPVYGFPQQSKDSDYTVFSYAWEEHGESSIGTWEITLRAGAKADFQVEAMIGYVADAGPFSDRSPREYFEGETSGWSSTQTITIGETSASTSPSSIPSSTQNTMPTPTPTVPEFSSLVILPLFVSLLFIAMIRGHRKTIQVS